MAPFLVDAAGNVITYEIKVFNTGNTTLTGVSIDDPLLSNEDCDGLAGAPYEQKTGFTIAVGGSLTVHGQLHRHAWGHRRGRQRGHQRSARRPERRVQERHDR